MRDPSFYGAQWFQREKHPRSVPNRAPPKTQQTTGTKSRLQFSWPLIRPLKPRCEGTPEKKGWKRGGHSISPRRKNGGREFAPLFSACPRPRRRLILIYMQIAGTRSARILRAAASMAAGFSCNTPWHGLQTASTIRNSGYRVARIRTMRLIMKLKLDLPVCILNEILSHSRDAKGLNDHF